MTSRMRCTCGRWQQDIPATSLWHWTISESLPHCPFRRWWNTFCHRTVTDLDYLSPEGRAMNKPDNETRAELQPSPERQQQLDNEMLLNLFTYHAPEGDDEMRYQNINAAALALAHIIHQHCPPGPDRSDAIRKVREARMTANASIATKGGFYR